MEQLSLGLPYSPLNPDNWDDPKLVECMHEKMLLRNIQLLKDSTPGGEQWLDIMWWINRPTEGVKTLPLSFARCCEVIGISDPDVVRSEIMIQLGIETREQEELLLGLEDIEELTVLD